jgi:hypothetical protein
MSRYAIWYSRLVWIGIAVNMLFVLPLVLAPSWFLGLLGIPLDQPIWARASGMLLFIISVFYIPGAMDPKRYRATAWMHVFPSRTFGSTFFFVAVLFFNQPLGFLSIAIVDGFFGHTTLYMLVQMTREEKTGGSRQY